MSAETTVSSEQINPRKAAHHIFAGLSASLIGIGLARFAYTPLLPTLIEQHWFSASAAVYLGAANLAGYLLGALIGRPLASRTSNVNVLRGMMILATVAFLACAFPLSESWFFVWRLMSGVAGGAIMVLVAATVLPHIHPKRRGIASGAVFLGLGLGIAASGTVVPLLLGFGLRATWVGLAAIAAVLTAASWMAWPEHKAIHLAEGGNAPTALPGERGAVLILYGEYALMAVGLVPAMVFLVDFVARGLGAGDRVGSYFWILYGVGAIAGPPIYGFLADHLGARLAMRILLLAQTVAVAALAVLSERIAVGFVCMLIGTFPPGIVPLVLAGVREISPHSVSQNAIWAKATIVFAAFQAAAAYAYSAVFNATGGSHRTLFAIGAVATLLALLAEFVPHSIFGAAKQTKRAA